MSASVPDDSRLGHSRYRCIHQLFEEQVERTPEAVAVTFEGQSVTYRELNCRANRLAHRLRELGVGPERLVGLRTGRGIELVIGIIGILKAGGGYLPLDPLYPKDRMAFMLSDSGADVIVTENSLKADCEGLGATVVLAGEPLSSPDSNPSPVATGANVAYALYTSGSTGKPKGVEVTHHNVARLFSSTFDWYKFNESDVWTLFHSYSFDFSVWELWGALIYGGRLVVVPYWTNRSTRDFLELLSRERVTVLNQTPSAFRQLIETELADPIDSLSLRYVIFGGEALTLESLRPWLEKYGDERPELVNMYGITETTVHVTYRPIRWADLRSGQGSVIGVPIPDLKVYILDHNGEPTPAGSPGEMYVGGEGVARGYINREDLNNERFLIDRFSAHSGGRLFRTGDLARRLDNGDIEYLGRADQQVKIRGFRVELGEIEATLYGHSAVAQCVVILREDNPGDQRLVAYVVLRDGEISNTELKQHLLRTLPAYMAPAAFVRLAELPLTSNGKIDCKALPAPDRSDFLQATYAAPRTPTEEILAGIWADALGLERVGIHDNFFELGGHSLLVISVLQKMHAAGLHASVQTIFRAPAVAALAAAVAEVGDEVEVPPNLIPADCQAISPEMLTLAPLSSAEIERVVDAVPGGAANIQDIYPLTPLQEGLLFHHRTAGGGDPYLVKTVFGSNSREQLDRYLQALQTVIDRHDILRTAFVWEGLSDPVQVVCRQAPLIVEELSLEAANGDIAAQLEQRFDPSHFRLDVRQAPVIRIFIAHDAANARWVMLRIHHHLLEDHTTDELMSEEIHLLLQGQVRQLPPALPFRNFVAQTRLGTPAEEHEAFFRGLLADVDEPTAPFGLTDIRFDLSEIAEARSPVDIVLANRLRETAHKHGVSAATLFHLAWAKVLSQCSGRDDIVFGTVLFGRMNSGQGAERVLGPLINTLPIRLQVGEVSVKDAIRQTHHRMAQLLDHEHASLAAAQSCSALAPSVPLFSALLNFRHLKIRGQIPKTANHAMAMAVSRMGLELLKFEERTNYPLELSVDDLGDAFMLEAQAQSPVDPRRICGYMHTALEQLVVALETSPLSTAGSLNVLPGAERDQLLVEWNQTKLDYPRDKCMHQLFEEQVRRTPDAVAVLCEGQSLTYRELNARANQLGHHLRSLGVGPEVLAGLCMERSLDMVVALLGILKAGGAYVALDPQYPEERLRFILEDTGLNVLVTGRSLDMQFPGLPLQLVHIDESLPDGCLENLDCLSAPDHLGYLIYTSGSTGVPKGVAIEHHSAVSFLHWVRETFTDEELSGVLFATSICFDLSVFEVFGPLCWGGKIIVVDNALGLAHCQHQQDVKLVNTVPSVMQTFLKSHALPASVGTVNLAGEPLRPPLVDLLYSFPHVRRVNDLYGPSETTTYSTWTTRGPRQAASIGRPLANTQVYLLNSGLNPVPVGTAGELWIGGEGVARGYWRRPDLTAERFIRDPFSRESGARLYRTGDLARYRPDGNLEYLGRTDHQVKIRGFRIELGEVEALLGRHPYLSECAVVTRGDGGDKTLAAFVVGREHAELSIESLRQWLGEKLPAYMIPSRFFVMPALPLTPNGKVDRKALETLDEPDLPGAAQLRSRDEGPAPHDSLEAWLVQIWEELLGIAPVGVQDNFFALGGHSLLATRLLARLESQLGKQLPPVTLFQAPTVGELAKLLRDPGKPDYQVYLAGSEISPDRPPLFCLHHLPAAQRLAQYLGPHCPVYGIESPLEEEFRRWREHRQLDISMEEIAARNLEIMQGVQPRGPYHLAGFGFGGVLAFEAASQLQRQGERVEFLALLNAAYRPGLRPRALPWLRRWSHHARLAATHAPTYLVEKFRKRPDAGKRRPPDLYLVPARRRDPDEVTEDARWPRARFHAQMLDAYRGKPYSGGAVLFRTIQEPVSFEFDLGTTNGWAEVMLEGLQVEELQCGHLDITEEPYVGEVAKRLVCHLLRKSCGPQIFHPSPPGLAANAS